MKPPLSPGIISLLPIFYVGWQDSILSPLEMNYIHKKIKESTILTEEDKQYLIKHTNPNNPPSSEVFKEWLDTIKTFAANLTLKEKSNLSSLAVEMATIHTDNLSQSEKKELYQYVQSIEVALGINDPTIQHRFFQQLHIDTNEIIDQQSFSSQKLYDITNFFNLDTKKSVRNLLKDPAFTMDEDNIIKEDIRNTTLQRLKFLANQGYGLYPIPEQYGGQLNMGKYMAVFEMIAYHDLSLCIKFGVQFGLFGGALLKLGTDYHHKKYLNKMGTGELLGCFAMTETGHGSNVKDLETTAIYDHSSKEITIHSPSFNSGKEYIGNALHAKYAAVFAQLIVNDIERGIHCVLVPLRDEAGNLLPGISVEDCGYKIGLNGVDNGRIRFQNVSVPKTNLLNRYGDIDDSGNYTSPIDNVNKRFFTMLGTLVGGRICVGIGAISATKTALAIATKYSLQRRQFAPKEGELETLLLDYPTHQQRIIPKLIKTYILHNALSKLAIDYCGEHDEKTFRKLETKAAGLKAIATWHATDTIQMCREACGGKGYLSENSLGRLKADSDIFTTFEGDNTVLLLLVAKGLLSDFQGTFHEEGFTAVLRYITGKLGFTLTELNPIFTRNTNVAHIESDEFQADALRYREKKILISLADRMKEYINKRMSPNDAFLKCQMHMLDAAKAYIDRLAYRLMVARVNELEESPEKDMMRRISRAYALDVIMENTNWYLENDYMEGSKSKAIRRVYVKNIGSFRKDCNGLIDALGVNTTQFYVKP